MKSLKTQDDTEKKRNEHRAYDVNTEKKTSDLASNTTQQNIKRTPPSISSDKSNDISVQKNNSNSAEDKMNSLTKNDVIPDKVGYNSIGTQTTEINTCRCCCTCKNSTFQ